MCNNTITNIITHFLLIPTVKYLMKLRRTKKCAIFGPPCIAKEQKAHGVCSGRFRDVGRHPSFRDIRGMFLVRHHWQCLHTVGSLQQRRRGEVRWD